MGCLQCHRQYTTRLRCLFEHVTGQPRRSLSSIASQQTSNDSAAAASRRHALAARLAEGPSFADFVQGGGDPFLEQELQPREAAVAEATVGGSDGVRKRTMYPSLFYPVNDT